MDRRHPSLMKDRLQPISLYGGIGCSGELGSFTVSISRGETYCGPVHFHEVSGEPLMIMAVPIIALDTGKTDGVLMVDVRLKEIWDLVAGIRPGLKGASFIVDDGKLVVAHSDPSVVGSEAPALIRPDRVQTGLSGQKSVLVSRIIRFGARQFNILRAPASGWPACSALSPGTTAALGQREKLTGAPRFISHCRLMITSAAATTQRLAIWRSNEWK